MVRDIVKDVAILTRKSERVEPGESVVQLFQDMMETASNYPECVGLAAVQVGVHKRICIVKTPDNKWTRFVNPIITKRSNSTHESEEGCLSIDGVQKVRRYDHITVIHDVGGKKKSLTVGGSYATIIQHEIDHMNGRLI